jgi:hypothetical protein
MLELEIERTTECRNLGWIGSGVGRFRALRLGRYVLGPNQDENTI